MKRWGPAYRSGFRITLLLTAGAALPLAALAQGAPSPPPSLLGKGLGYVAELISLPSAGFVALVLSILQSLLTALLDIVAFFLNNVFYYNLVLTPNAMPAVQEGWALMRDIANSFFILIILWIAFTIIFNLENLGGKKLLARVIIVALLINFSLAMVSLVFGFANVLAKPFRDAIKQTDVAGFIVNRASLQTIVKTPTSADLESNQRLIQQARRETTPDVEVGGFTFLDRWGLRPSYAANGDTSAGCGFGALADPRVTAADTERGTCIGIGDAAAFASSLFSGFTQTFGSITGLWSIALAAAIGSIFLILVIASFIAAAATLLARIIAMVFLSVLAPLAFLAFVVPGGKFTQWWDKWLSSLFKWAFFAPAFYFLFYVSLKVFAVMTDTPLVRESSRVNFSGNFIQMLPLLVFLGFLWASIMVARWLGVAVAADIGMKFAKFAGGLAMGATKAAALLPFRAAAVTARPLAARGAAAVLKPGGAVSRGLRGIAATPGLRWVGGAYPQRAAARFIKAQQKKIEEQGKDVALFSKDQAFADYNATFIPERKVAHLERFAKEGWVGDFEKQPGGREALLRGAGIASRYGAQEPILQLAPHLLTNENASTLVPGTTSRHEAIIKLTAKMKAEDKPKISREVFGTPNLPDVLSGLIFSIKGVGDLSRLARENARLYEAMVKHNRNNLAALTREFTDPRGIGKTTEEFTAIQNSIREYEAGRLAQRQRRTEEELRAEEEEALRTMATE